MRIGFDIHGCLDTHPAIKSLMVSCIGCGDEVYILTGATKEKAIKDLKEADLGPLLGSIVEIFSITDYLLSLGTPYEGTLNEPYFNNSEAWIKAKGEYCQRNKIALLIDDHGEYKQYCPKEIVFLHLINK